MYSTNGKQVCNILPGVHEPIGLQDANNFPDIPFRENISICDYLKDH